MTIHTRLMDHQREIVEWSKNKLYFGIFADFGTGKTLCALSHVEMFKFRKTLVVSTKTAVESTWCDEIRKHTNFTYVSLLGNKRRRLNQLNIGLRKSMIDATAYHSVRETPVIFLINFDGVRAIYNELVQANFNFIVVDESTKIKSPKTLRTKALWRLGKGIRHRCIMTGFPVTEKLTDLYSQIKFLDGGEVFGNSYYRFLDSHFTRIAYKYLPKRKAIQKVLKKIKPFCIHVTNESLKLPPKRYKTVQVPMTQQQKYILKQLNETFQVAFGRVKIDSDYIFTLINKSLQINDGFIQNVDKETKVKTVEALKTNKDEYLLDLLDEIDITRNKVVIWCAYRFSIRKIKKILKKMGHRVLTLTASTKDVQKTVRRFQAGKSHNVLIATQRKASESITLTACNYAIYYSNTWSFDARANSEGRIYRKGSERHKRVFYTDLVVKGSIEERVVDSLLNKKNLIAELKKEFSGIRA